MLPVAEWNESYILSLPVGEFDWLEVKGRKSLDLTVHGVKESSVLESLSKEVSALANSGGGAIVYGLVDPEADQKEWRVDDGAVAVDMKRNGTREWLETVIPHQMEPALEKFNVYAVPASSSASQIGEGRALFVIDVPDSQQAPHQATDKRYYARVGSRARPIGHQLVVDIMNRRQHPKVKLDFRIEVRDNKIGGTHHVVRTLHLHMTATNVARVYAQYITVILHLPIAVTLTSDEIKRTEALKREKDEGVVVFFDKDAHRRYTLNNLNGSVFIPLLPTLSRSWEIEISGDTLPRDHVSLPLIWEVFADNSPSESGSLQFHEIPINGA